MAVLGGLVAVLGVGLVVLLAFADPSADLTLEGAKTAMNLIVAVLITGVLSAVLWSDPAVIRPQDWARSAKRL